MASFGDLVEDQPPNGNLHLVTVTAPDGTTTEITGTDVILAAGSVPRMIPNFERGGPIMSSDEILDLDHVPGRLAVIGGGAIGCEFASTFADLGSQVTILEALPKILPGLDADVANVVVAQLQEEAHRHPHRSHGQRPHAERRRRHDGALRRRREPRRRRRRRVRRSPPVRRPPRPRRHRCQGRRARVRGRRRALPHGRGRRVRHRRPHQHAAARPCRLRRGDPGRQADTRRDGRAGDVRPGAVGDLLPPRGRLGRARARRTPRRRATTSSSPSTPSSSTPAPRSSARPTAWPRSSPSRTPTAGPAASSACTWSARGSPSC